MTQNLPEGANSILRVLKEHGPKTNTEIMKLANISSAAFYVNKKTLEHAGLISSGKEGRQTVISLRDPSTVSVKTPASTAKPPREVIAAVVEKKVRPLSAEIDAGLTKMAARNKPIADAETKIAVLTEIGDVVPETLRTVIRDIVNDIATRA